MPETTKETHHARNVEEPAVEQTPAWKRAKLTDGRTADDVEYCPYTETSQNYDTRRVNPGVGIILGSMCLNKLGLPLDKQSLLDVGCGTGSFLEQIYTKVGKVAGVEYNEGMISKGTERFQKLVTKSGNTLQLPELVQGAAQKLSFQNDSFHAVTVNQVVHHFSSANNYEELLVCFQEAFRVLKSGGVFVLNTSMPLQQQDAFWWLSLFPDQSKRMCKRFPPLAVIKKYLTQVGFELTADSVTVPLERALMNEKMYLDEGYKLAFKKEYRDCDSSWEMPKDELEKGLELLKAKASEGTVQAWLQGREQRRMEIGQATFVTVYKP